MHELKFKGITYEDFLKQYDLTCLRPFPSILWPAGLEKKPGKVLYLRHDIDSNIDASVAMAEYEASIGIKSAYYALHFSDYWDAKGFRKLKKIQDMGHEIGFHNAIFSEYIVKTGKKPDDSWSFEEYEHLQGKLAGALAKMRDAGLNVRGTCAHGHPTCITHEYGNIQLWKQYGKPFRGEFSLDMAEYGLEYDCNIAYRDAYHSDSGNEWHGPVEDPRKVANLFRNTDITLMINVHPQWWW